MTPEKGSPCTACNPVRHWSEFLKILERGDVGITIYRYRGPAGNGRLFYYQMNPPSTQAVFTHSARAGNGLIACIAVRWRWHNIHFPLFQEMGESKKPKQTFIFYTTKKVTERPAGIDIYTAEAKCMNYCPRCIAMMRRIEALLKNTPPDREADLCEVFSCPPCLDVVHKFRKFTTEDDLLNKQHDSELIHLQRLTSPSVEFATARSKFENLVRLGAKNNALMKKTGADDKDLQTKATKLPKLSEKSSLNSIDIGSKIALDKSSKHATGTIKDKEGKSLKSLGQISKAKKTKSGDKLASSTKVGKEKDKSKSEKESTRRKSVSESKVTTKATTKEQSNRSASKLVSMSAEQNPLIRMKIAEHITKQTKQEQASRNQAQQLHKSRKDIDDKLNNAAKKEEEARNARLRAEEARQLKFKLAMNNMEELKSDSLDNKTDVCSDESVIDWMIKGNKICKATKIKEEQVEKPVAALPSITTRSSIFMAPHPPPTPASGDKTMGSRTTVRKFQDGRIKYNLSERKYVHNGWTILPREMVMRKVTLFQMHPARNEFDWLEMNRHRERVLYDSGEQLATFDENGCARVYYRNGVLALDFYQAQEENAGGYRVVVYSDGRPLERGRAPLHTVLATFDYSGNGAVFYHTGQPRLKYSQNEGVVLDRTIGPYTHWKWHNLNDTGRLQTVLIENEPKNKDPKIMKLEEEIVSQGKRGQKSAHHVDEKSVSQGDEKSANKTEHGSQKSVYLSIGEKSGNEKEEPVTNDEKVMRAIESHNVIKENFRLLKRFSPFQIKMKAFKINENFSLRIIDQASVFLTFTDGKTRLRINVGMVLDPTVVLGQALEEVGEVTSSLEKVAASESLEELQRVVRGARAAERARVLREQKLNPPVSHDPPPCKDRRRTK